MSNISNIDKNKYTFFEELLYNIQKRTNVFVDDNFQIKIDMIINDLFPNLNIEKLSDKYIHFVAKCDNKTKKSHYKIEWKTYLIIMANQNLN